jgi:hypothetical protein
MYVGLLFEFTTEACLAMFSFSKSRMELRHASNSQFVVILPSVIQRFVSFALAQRLLHKLLKKHNLFHATESIFTTLQSLI